MAKRRFVQLISAVLYNLNVNGFLTGHIYKGASKSLCVPGLNCYSCPGAIGSCPLGSLQAVLGSARHKVSLYVAGFLIVAGTLFGRFICGWACPFGLIQELLYKIPGRKIKANRLFGTLKYLKYVLLVVFVIALPIIFLQVNGVTVPAFCKYICPSGTLEAGIPLVLLDARLQSVIGWLFSWKVLVLAAILLFSVLIFRPFCRFICPLGAIYALFNKYSVFGITLEKKKCTSCKACARACKMDIEPDKTPNHPECIRCGDCIKACPSKALHYCGPKQK